MTKTLMPPAKAKVAADPRMAAVTRRYGKTITPSKPVPKPPKTKVKPILKLGSKIVGFSATKRF